MSTGKIGRTLNPRSKVTPGYTTTPENREVKRHELLEKLDEVVLSVKEDLKPLLESVEEQNKLLLKLHLKIDTLENKVIEVEKINKELKSKLDVFETRLFKINSNCEVIVNNTKKEKNEVVEESKKGWFR